MIMNIWGRLIKGTTRIFLVSVFWPPEYFDTDLLLIWMAWSKNFSKSHWNNENKSKYKTIFAIFTLYNPPVRVKTQKNYFDHIKAIPSVRARGYKLRMCSPYPQRDRKRRLIGAVCRNHRIKRVVPCRCLNGHVKEPYEMSMAWEPDRGSNFFFSPPAHLCAVTYMTELSLIVTLNN